MPTNVIRNDGLFIDNGTFLLFARLCLLYFKNYRNPEIKIDHKKLMRNTLIHDTRTLKKRLGILYKVGLIENEIATLPKKEQIVILLNEKMIKDQQFTKMSIKAFDCLLNEDINEHSFRLLFYYKSHINLSADKKLNYCFVGIETLKVRLKMGSDTISEANKELKKNKLIKIVRHKLKHDDTYDENDELIYDKFNNHYIVNEELF